MILKVFEEFVQSSPHEPQVVNHDTGVWRLLHVRINRAQQLMVVVLINPTVLDSGAMATLRTELIEYFSTGPASKHGVISLYLHTDNDIKTLGADKNKRPQGNLELLWGQSHMVEQLLDLHLDIDPNFYFQNNTWGAEVLYRAVTELAAVDEETTVLDLCCGSGGMGMMFAKQCKEVIGVEVQDVNVDDAKKLAAKNGLTNCEFLQGSVDDLFPELEEKLKGKKVVPILDPPRSGISSKLILSLRKMKEAERIIYVCSNHKLPSKNIMDLALVEGENNEYVGTNPFFPTKVIPVDISPHSLRCELVILLERLDLDKIPKAKRSAPSKLARCLYYASDRRGKRGRDSVPRGRRPYGREPEFNRGYNNYSMPVAYPMRRPMDRYSSFRRDVEEAIDVSYPGRPGRGGGPMSRRLAMANAMLEQGLRLASEAMAEDEYRPPGPRPRPPPPMMRRGPPPPMMDEYAPPIPRPRPPPMMRRPLPPPSMMDDYSTPLPPSMMRRGPPSSSMGGWGQGGMQGKKILNSLRKLEGVNRIIYVCSNHRPPVKDFLELANVSNADPFVAKRIIPVDITPHSLRCELVIKCERIPIKDLPVSKRSNTSKKNSKKAARSNHPIRSNQLPSRSAQLWPSARRNKQEIDYLKRDSLYPAVLRDALYRGREEEYYGQQRQFPKQHREVGQSGSYKMSQYDKYQRDGAHVPYASGYPFSRYDRFQQPLDSRYAGASGYAKYDRFQSSINGYSSRGCNKYPHAAEVTYSSRYPNVSENMDSVNRYDRFQQDLKSVVDEMSYPPRQSLTNTKLAYANALLEEGMRIASEVLETDYSKKPSRRYHY